MSRVMLVVSTLGRGGAERVVSVLSEYAARQGVDVSVIVFSNVKDRYPSGGKLINLGLPEFGPIPFKCVQLLRRAFALIRLFRRERPDRIISFMESSNYPSLIAAWWCGLRDRLSISIHDNPDNFPGWYHLASRALYPLARRVVCVSNGVRTAVLRRYRILPDRCVTVWNPIAVDTVQRLSGEPLSVELPVAPRVMAMGRLAPQKGFDMLLDAFAIVASRTQAHLVIIGAGPELQALQQQSVALNLKNRVMFIGLLSNPFSVLSKADVFVVSSRHEGFPLVLAEALGLGLPCVSFDCHYGPAEVLVNGEYGILVSPCDVKALADRLLFLLAESAERTRLRDKARIRARELDVTRLWPRWADLPPKEVSEVEAPISHETQARQ